MKTIYYAGRVFYFPRTIIGGRLLQLFKYLHRADCNHLDEGAGLHYKKARYQLETRNVLHNRLPKVVTMLHGGSYATLGEWPCKTAQ